MFSAAAHQSGHNSGVVHAGIYYTPGTLKAQLCVKGMELSYNYFEANQVPYKRCGKLIVAVEPDEVSRLQVCSECDENQLPTEAFCNKH